MYPVATDGISHTSEMIYGFGVSTESDFMKIITIPLFIFVSRVLQTHVFNSLNFLLCRNAIKAATRDQMEREKANVHDGFVIHFFASVGLCFLFPTMFHSNQSVTNPCGKQHLREIATPDWVGQFTNITYW